MGVDRSGESSSFASQMPQEQQLISGGASSGWAIAKPFGHETGCVLGGRWRMQRPVVAGRAMGDGEKEEVTGARGA